MTTGTVVGAVAHCEIHQAIVAKCRALSIKDTQFVGAQTAAGDELNQLFVNNSLAPKAVVHHVAVLETIEKLNKL